MFLNIFFKTGEYRDRDGGWDGDQGYYEEVLVPYDKIDKVVSNLIYEDYFAHEKIQDSEEQKVKKGLKKLVSDLDYRIYDYYKEQLEEYFSENPDEI